MFSPTGSRDPVFECASPSNPLQTRRSAAAEAQRLPQEEHTWTAGDWVVGRNAKAEFALTNDDLASIDVRRVGGGRLDIRRPKKYYSRPDLHRLSEQKHGGRAMWKTAAQRRRPIRPPAMIRPASAGSSSGWPPVLASLGQPRPAPASLSSWHVLVGRPCPPCLPHRSPRHRQARDHEDDPHLSFADDSLPCRQERVPEPQGQEPPGVEAVARLNRPLFAHVCARGAGATLSALDAINWACGYVVVRRFQRVERLPAEITASHGFVLVSQCTRSYRNRVIIASGGLVCGQRM